MEILHPQPLISSWVSGAAVLARNPKLPCPVASSHLDGPGTTLRRCSDHVLHHGAAVLLWVSHRRVTCHPLSKRGATHLSEKTHFGPLYLQPCPIGQGPALKARGGGRNQAWPVDKDRSALVSSQQCGTGTEVPPLLPIPGQPHTQSPWFWSQPHCTQLQTEIFILFICA